MPSYTPNHEFQLFADDETPWEHRTDFQKLDGRTPIVDTNANRVNYNAKQNALYLASDTDQLYRGNGSSWVEIRKPGSVDPNTVGGIANTRTHVGPFHQGEAPQTADDWGLAFAAQDGLTIHSAVLDPVNVDTVSGVDSATIEFYPVDSRDAFGITTGALIDTVNTPTLSNGPNRVDLGFTIPSGDGYSEYAMTIAPVQGTGGNYLQFRRISGWAGWGDYSDLAGDGIDLLQGGRLNNPTSSDYSANYYYFFDMEVGDATTNVTSPWSHDVEEIYMRPRDPAEEYDDISPRALWIQT